MCSLEKQAYLTKLATVALASSHVLKQRALLKQAKIRDKDTPIWRRADTFPETLRNYAVDAWKNGDIASTLIGAGLGGGLGYYLNRNDNKKGRILAALSGAGIGGLGLLGTNQVRKAYNEAKRDAAIVDALDRRDLLGH